MPLKTPLSEVWFLAGQIGVEIQEWMKRRDGKFTKLSFSEEEKLRLLKLRTWSLRYRLPVAEILDMIVPVLLEKVKFRKRYGFYFPIRTLVGDGAKATLEIEISKRYPSREHLLVWKEQERELQLLREQEEVLDGLPMKPHTTPVRGENEDLDDYMERYTKSAMAMREKQRRTRSEKWRKRKNYRNNPWI